jgi:hypothetical protein
MTQPTTTTEQPIDPRGPSPRGDLLRDVGIVLGWFLVAGVLGALLWWKLVDLPQATRAQGSVVVESDQLGKEVNIDGWFFVIAAVGGLVSGIVLTLWRRRDPLLVVVMVTLGGGLASFVMQRLGLLLGPGSEVAALRHEPDGAHALMRLHIHATGVLWVWPAAAALGALVYLWVLKTPEEH